MYISLSNLLTSGNTAITQDAGSNPLSYLLNRDFSEVYRSGTTSNQFRIEITQSDVGYIGIAGLDVYGKCSSIDFEYWNGTQYVIDKTYPSQDENGDTPALTNSTIMHINERYQYATKWRLTFNKILSNTVIGVAYLACGKSWNVPNGGEEAGYSRLWSTPQFAQRVQSNQGMPTASVIESIGLSGSVSFSNILTSDVVSVWSPLQGYAVREGVFIVEQEFYGDRAYYCYNCQPSPVKAHSQTRSLQSASMKFDAWTGRTI
jgi:hypothetical protein